MPPPRSARTRTARTRPKNPTGGARRGKRHATREHSALPRDPPSRRVRISSRAAWPSAPSRQARDPPRRPSSPTEKTSGTAPPKSPLASGSSPQAQVARGAGGALPVAPGRSSRPRFPISLWSPPSPEGDSEPSAKGFAPSKRRSARRADERSARADVRLLQVEITNGKRQPALSSR